MKDKYEEQLELIRGILKEHPERINRVTPVQARCLEALLEEPLVEKYINQALSEEGLEGLCKIVQTKG
ncbi:hypothetical protein ACFLRC_03630 [Candidatus Altiarchaeota archaeon]